MAFRYFVDFIELNIGGDSLRHPVPPMLALRERSRVAPDFHGGFRRFQRLRARRRGGESRLGRGGGRGPRDRLARQVRWSGFERCTTDPVSVGSAERRIPGWIPASPGICRFKNFSHRGGRAHGTETDHDARRAWTCTGRCNVASRRWTRRQSLSPQSVGYRDGSLPPPTSWCA